MCCHKALTINKNTNSLSPLAGVCPRQRAYTLSGYKQVTVGLKFHDFMHSRLYAVSDLFLVCFEGFNVFTIS